MALRARHITSDIRYRDPFGAVPVGGAVSLRVDVWDDPAAKPQLRVWVDGKGESLLDMVEVELDEGEKSSFWGDVPSRFEVKLEFEEPQILWYYFNIKAGDGSIWRYGAAREHGCGEGAFCYGEPPAFQITVYDQKRKTLPTWYENGVVYQVFPDRFYRGSDWERNVHVKLDAPHQGPGRHLVGNWYDYPRYDRSWDGRINSWDFYGGTLEGVREKLPYLEDLGVTVIYLNPIFEAASNHRYDTGDYLKVDPMLGSEEDFSRLCSDAQARGISIILDGVFNHVGVDSRYFNLYGNYGDTGCKGESPSPYDSWFHFRDDGSYESWWGVDDLPDVDEDNPDYRELILGHDGVIRKWLRLGARGWRLDVADELSDGFIADIKRAALAERPDAVVIGEVWEDATTKVAYGKLRHYFWGDELDATMNYPLREALLDYLTNRIGAPELCRRLESLCENYPPEAFASELNLLGSHDRVRLLTVLGDAPAPESMDDWGRYCFRLDKGHRSLAQSRMRLAALLQMTLPGVPCIYYGDEAGLEGYADPYCRAPFPWGREDHNIFNIYRGAVAVRKASRVFVKGSFKPFAIGDDVFGFWREDAGEKVCVLVNSSLTQSHTVSIPLDGLQADEIMKGKPLPVEDGCARVFLWPLGRAVLNLHAQERLQMPMSHGMGVVCHVTSVPNPAHPGMPGTLGAPSFSFVDYLSRAGQRYWQVLPVNPTDKHGSPYAGLSAFAGNPRLMERGPENPEPSVKELAESAEYQRFMKENEEWLIPYATFCAIKEKTDDSPWQEWPERYRDYTPDLAESKELKAEVERVCAEQFEFMRQWREMRSYANSHGIKIIGDMPMYVSGDSSDVWAHRDLFCVDESGYASLQAGAPPDAFSATGQLWGNPTYRWDVMRKRDYDWWMRRLRRSFELYDYVRLDHFLGFSSYYTIEQGKGAMEGAWNFGPGVELFERASKEFGQIPVVAEDLGAVTPAVRMLVSQTGFPGMDVVQFADEDPCEGYAPLPGKICYTSTHDTNTLRGWATERYDLVPGPWASDGEREWKCNESGYKADWLMEVCLRSGAEVVMTTLQDVLRLDGNHRMNVPGVAEGNWSWQANQDEVLGSEQHLRWLAEMSGRLGS